MNENEMKKTEEQRQRVNNINIGNLGKTLENCSIDEQNEIVKYFNTSVLIKEIEYRVTTAEERVDAIKKITKATR